MNLRRLLHIISKSTWRKPTKCQVVQFGGLEVTALSLLADEFKIGVMPLISEQVSLPVVLRMLLRLRLSRWVYYLEYMQMTDARVVLVWQETNTDAYQLRHHGRIPVLCIQNGVRHNVGPVSGKGFMDALQEDAKLSHPTADAYFCFGAAEPRYLDSVIETRFVPHGSLRANAYARQRLPKSKCDQVSGIGFIVSFPHRQSIPGGSIIGNNTPFLRLGDRVMSYHEYYSFDALVSKAIQNVSRELALEYRIIAKRSEETSSEVQFFQDVHAGQVEVLAHAKGEGYELADRFEYLITVDSTLGYEMRALGKPVAFLSNRLKHLDISDRDLTFGFPLNLPADGPYWSSAITEPEIVQFLHRWIELVVSQKTQKDSFELMHLDHGNTQLRGMIRTALENAS